MFINYHSTNLKKHKSAQCHIDLFDNGDIRFISYTTTVIYYCKHLDRLYCTGTYSQTTRKQIGWFLREYFPCVSYQNMRNCYEYGLTMSSIGIHGRKLNEHEQSILFETSRGSNLYPIDFED